MAWHPFRNIGLKVMALALGTLLWLTVSGHQIERRVRVPLSYGNVPADLELTSEQDDVSVLVRGADTEVSPLGPGDLRVIVDLGGAREGSNLVNLGPDQVEAQLGVEVLRIEPSTVSVMLERSARREVPIEPTLEGQPAPGFAVGRITIQPPTVAVVGPESRLAQPAAVVTDRVRIEGLRATARQDVNVASTDSQVRLMQPRPVRVTVEILPTRTTR
jgi:YbbR domain-containing protein